MYLLPVIRTNNEYNETGTNYLIITPDNKYRLYDKELIAGALQNLENKIYELYPNAFLSDIFNHKVLVFDNKGNDNKLFVELSYAARMTHLCDDFEQKYPSSILKKSRTEDYRVMWLQ